MLMKTMAFAKTINQSKSPKCRRNAIFPTDESPPVPSIYTVLYIQMGTAQKKNFQISADSKLQIIKNAVSQLFLVSLRT